MMGAIILFSMYMRKLYIPIGKMKWRIFELFPILLAIAVVWIYGSLLATPYTLTLTLPKTAVFTSLCML